MSGRGKEVAVISRSAEIETHIESHAANASDAFRKFFETQFKPLKPLSEAVTRPAATASENGDEDSGSEWDGFTDREEEILQVEVIEHKAPNKFDDSPDKVDRKEFMTAKPPSISEASFTKNSTATTKKEADDEATTDAENLKNDLALQRLLKESHLLDSATDLTPLGKNRHKAMDLRLLSLGAKTSLFEQQKMPMSHRKGINAKSSKKEETRRREAKENGIILERPAFKAKSNPKRRERGVGAPSVGKFTGSTLRLSNRDLISMKGGSKSFTAKRKARR